MIRRYRDSDYNQLRDLYFHSEWYGNNFDSARDSQEKLASVSARDPDSVLVYMQGEEMVGSISIVENGRAALIFRFVVKNNSTSVAEELYEKAIHILRKRGHTQAITFCPISSKELNERYEDLGMTLGGRYYTYWSEI